MRSNRFQGCRDDYWRGRRLDGGQPHRVSIPSLASERQRRGASRPSDTCLASSYFLYY